MTIGMERRPLLAVVTGPTASGKTALAIDIARHFSTEIVSADSRQVYADIPIGTAAPAPEQLAQVRHHLVGFLPLEVSYSAARFEQDALRCLQGIWQNNRLAVVCGGSMMYIDTLLHGIDPLPDISAQTREYVLSMLANHGLEGVLAQLRICDPDYWQQVDRSNTRRVVHALEVCLQAGRPYSSLRTGRHTERPFDTIRIAIDHPREELFRRIGLRVEEMFSQGLEEEARKALAKGNYNSLNTVGYKELAAYFRGETTIDHTIAKIARNTRVYAKKQLTWLKRNPDTIWLAPENASQKAIAAIADRLC